jgi:4-hydroxy-tetrahydrodipicolinate synthase
MNMIFRGNAPALITPFKKSGEIDYAAYENHVRFQIDNGVSAVVVLGTTGEAATLTNAERIRLIEETVRTVNKRVSVIAGAGSNSTSETLSLGKDAKNAGADGLLIVTPYYNKPTDEGCYRHFSEIANGTDIPIIAYNVPGRTGKNMHSELVLRLAEIPNVVAVKEASGNLGQVMEILDNRPAGFAVYSGEDDLTLPLCSLGSDGVISVVSNEVPGEFSRMVQLGLSGEIQKAREIHYRLLPLMKVNFIESNPIPVKTALALMGRIEETFRLPLVPMNENARNALKSVLSSLKLIT